MNEHESALTAAPCGLWSCQAEGGPCSREGTPEASLCRQGALQCPAQSRSTQELKHSTGPLLILTQVPSSATVSRPGAILGAGLFLVLSSSCVLRLPQLLAAGFCVHNLQQRQRRACETWRTSSHRWLSEAYISNPVQLLKVLRIKDTSTC